LNGRIPTYKPFRYPLGVHGTVSISWALLVVRRDNEVVAAWLLREATISSTAIQAKGVLVRVNGHTPAPHFLEITPRKIIKLTEDIIIPRSIDSGAYSIYDLKIFDIGNHGTERAFSWTASLHD
jgi:hypothetical protein